VVAIERQNWRSDPAVRDLAALGSLQRRRAQLAGLRLSQRGEYESRIPGVRDRAQARSGPYRRARVRRRGVRDRQGPAEAKAHLAALEKLCGRDCPSTATYRKRSKRPAVRSRDPRPRNSLFATALRYWQTVPGTRNTCRSITLVCVATLVPSLT
jgi:hypothetical protein